jgi:hypothetical protein
VGLPEHGLQFGPARSRAYVHARHIQEDGAILGLGSRTLSISHKTTDIGTFIGLRLVWPFFQWCVFHKSP